MRLELIHPMLVHFPIALLLTGVILKLVGVLGKKRRFYPTIDMLSRCILTFGALFAWMAIIAGEVAEDIVETSA